MDGENQVIVTLKDWDDDFCVSIRDFIEELEALLENVPEPYKSAASIAFDRTGNDYDYSRGELTAQFGRPKTEEEIASEKRYAETSARERERRERDEFERLKAKFG